jgi:hypothetical protein
VATGRPSITDEDLLRLPKDGRKYELVDGEIRVSPGGARHGQISVRLSVALLAFVGPKRLGRVFASSTGYRLPGGNVRSPDTSFVLSNRLPRVPEGFAELAPDLAVEVLSPEDSPRDVLDRVGEYLAARSATSARSGQTVFLTGKRCSPDSTAHSPSCPPELRLQIGEAVNPLSARVTMAWGSVVPTLAPPRQSVP